MGKYSLTKEHRAELGPWAEKWIKNAMSTKKMDAEEKEICREAVKKMYRLAKIEPPPDHRIVFVLSPFIMSFAGGFSAGVWYLREQKAATTDAAATAAAIDATYDAIYAAIYAATDDDATYDDIYAATRAATYDDIYVATRAATDDAATDAATRAATDDAAAGKDHWYSFPCDAAKIAGLFGPAKFLLQCAQKSYRMRNGGNQWSGWIAFLSFFRHVVGLKLNYDIFDPYEKLGVHSGPRIIHEKFCIISDRPLVLKVDEFSRPHCEDGPFCQWRDGSQLFAIHGVRLSGWIVENPEKITLAHIRTEKNAEIRRIMIDRYGPGRYFFDTGAKVVDMDSLTLSGSAPRALMQDESGEKWLVGSDGSTERIYTMPVPREAATCRQAHEMIAGFEEKHLIAEA